MTTNWHDPIATGAPANSGIVNAPLSQLDSAITTVATDLDALETNFSDLENGTDSFVQVNLGADTTLTIAGGIVTATRTMHLIETEGAAAADDLTTISGGADGDWLIISCVNASRVVTVKHNNGVNGIYTAHQGDIILDDTKKKVVLYYDATASRWVQNFTFINIRPSNSSTLTPAATLTFPIGAVRSSGPNTGNNRPYVDVKPGWARRSQRWVQAAAAVFQSVGLAAVTTSGTLTEANDTDSAYVQAAITATTGSFGGFISASFDLVRRQYDPYFACLIRTSTVITVMRFWIGITSAAIGNTDNPGGAGTSFAGFRYSTVAVDPAWMAVTADGAATSTLTTGVGITTSTAYLFQMRVDSANGIVYFSVNDSTEVTLSANLPATTTELGFQVRAETRENVAKNLLIARMACEFN